MAVWPCVLVLSVTVVDPEPLKELSHLSRGECRKGPGRTGPKNMPPENYYSRPTSYFSPPKSCHSLWKTLTDTLRHASLIQEPLSAVRLITEVTHHTCTGPDSLWKD